MTTTPHVHCNVCRRPLTGTDAIEAVLTRPYTLEVVLLGFMCAACIERIVFPAVVLARTAHLN